MNRVTKASLNYCYFVFSGGIIYILTSRRYLNIFDTVKKLLLAQKQIYMANLLFVSMHILVMQFCVNKERTLLKNLNFYTTSSAWNIFRSGLYLTDIWEIYLNFLADTENVINKINRTHISFCVVIFVFTWEFLSLSSCVTHYTYKTERDS